MKYVKLSEIAGIQSGLVLSRKEAKRDSASVVEYKNLNLRSLNDDSGINVQLLDRYLASEKLEGQFITRIDDIIVRLFPPFCPAHITETLAGLVVPSQFAIIRLQSNMLLPAFLCCYLAHRNVLKSLAIRESGQASGGIKISALSELSIPLLPMERQRSISAYSEMNAKQKRLQFELIQQYDLKMDAVLNSAIGGK